ncbi:hypothetical protein E7Y31_19870 [Candidatus Frankia alpina]|uniref:Uncharacterized protein n=1 Tax=Candidatus Frankia alpina TaxID=2699483 RepID=A0A4S5CHP4_9ACTN|nr:hypothetical protein [Candidatus Frankia alpina]THJ45367.1 hypothetical protein E7Y31_19870 [Candidatus Frankia alpina]
MPSTAAPTRRTATSRSSSSGAAAHSGRVDPAPVETTSIAPTILALLGLNPNELSAVRTEHTRTLHVAPAIH